MKQFKKQNLLQRTKETIEQTLKKCKLYFCIYEQVKTQILIMLRKYVKQTK